MQSLHSRNRDSESALVSGSTYDLMEHQRQPLCNRPAALSDTIFDVRVIAMHVCEWLPGSIARVYSRRE